MHEQGNQRGKWLAAPISTKQRKWIEKPEQAQFDKTEQECDGNRDKDVAYNTQQ